jgi:hypothetical protein
MRWTSLLVAQATGREDHRCILTAQLEQVICRQLLAMPPEFLNGRELSADQLEALRHELESFDSFDEVSDEMRGIIERNWPHLAAKLPPREE